MRIAILTTMILAAIPNPRPSAPGPGAILGWWHGTSTCTKADWNAACNDEVILYQFVAMPPDSAQALLHASKIVDGKPEPMGDLPLRYSPDSATWNGDFANGRVDIRLTYRISGDTLFGQLFLRPDMRVARQIVALRGRGSTP